MNKELKIIFMGTPRFAAESLEALVKEFDVKAVFTQMDKPKGRGKKLAMSEVKEVALKHGIELWQPQRLRNDDAAINRIREINPDLIVVVAYGQILSTEVIDIPRLGCINLHASLLPKYRGASPIQSVIINGEKVTGNTVMQMDEGLDTGDMLKKSELVITENMTYGQLHDLLMEDGKKLLIETIKELNENKIIKIKQNDLEASYSGKIEKKDEVLDFSQSAKEVHDRVRGLSPTPLASTSLDGKILKIAETVLSNEDCKGKYGEIIRIEKDSFTVCCNNSAIIVKKVQPQGKKVMSVRDFLNGNKVEIHSILGL